MSDLFTDDFLAKIERLALAARRREGSGPRRPDRRGGRQEFADHRAYSPGDDLRTVDWHLFGRIGDLFVKEFVREEEADVDLVLDTSSSMEKKIRGALRLAAALATIALVRGDRLRIATAADGALAMSRTLAGEGRRREMLEAIEALQAAVGGRTDLDASLAKLPPSRGARVLLLISDLLAERDGRRRLAVHAGDVFVFHWLAPEERAPGAAGRVLLKSVEGGELAAWVGPAEAARYAEEFERHADELRRFLTRHGARYLFCPAERPVEDLVLRMLVREGVLR